MVTILGTYKNRSIYIYGYGHLNVVSEQEQLALAKGIPYKPVNSGFVWDCENKSYNPKMYYWSISIYCSNKRDIYGLINLEIMSLTNYCVMKFIKQKTIISINLMSWLLKCLTLIMQNKCHTLKKSYNYKIKG